MDLTGLYDILYAHRNKSVLESAARIYHESGSQRRLLEVQFRRGEKPRVRDAVLAHLKRAVMSNAQLEAERKAGKQVEEHDHVVTLRQAIHEKYGQELLRNIVIEEFEHKPGRMKMEHKNDPHTVRITWVENPAASNGTARTRQQEQFRRGGRWYPKNDQTPPGWKKPGQRARE